MGSQSHPCAISGLPVSYSHPAVAIAVEPGRWTGTPSGVMHPPYIPSAWPIFGTFDGDYSLDDTRLPDDFIIIHRAIWDNFELFLPSGCNNTSDWISMDEHLASDCVLGEGLPREDQIFYSLQSHLSHTELGLHFRNLILPKPEAQGSVLDQTEYSFLGRSHFMQSILTEAAKGKWTAERLDTLTRITVLFSTQVLTGHKLVPQDQQTYVEQSPRWEQRTQIRAFFADLCHKLQHGESYSAVKEEDKAHQILTKACYAAQQDQSTTEEKILGIQSIAGALAHAHLSGKSTRELAAQSFSAAIRLFVGQGGNMNDLLQSIAPNGDPHHASNEE
jgi:hypothetical protein